MSKCGMTRGQSQLVAALLCPSLIEQVCSAGWHVDKAVATFSLSSLGLLCPTSTATSNKLCPTSWIGRQKWEEGKKLLWEIYSHLRTPGFNAKVELLLLLYNMQTHLTHYWLPSGVFDIWDDVFGIWGCLFDIWADIMIVKTLTQSYAKHRKNCECCPVSQLIVR